MNTNLSLGIIVFFLWSTFSSWYYVCQIKGLCLESTPLDQKQILSVVPTSEEKDSVIKAEVVEPIKTEESQPTFLPISISEDNIYFKKNSSNFLNTSYVQSFTEELKAEINNREVEIRIVGFTCDLGRAKYNLKLGQLRAEAMQKYLVSNSINPSKFDIQSKGEEEAVSGTEEERQKNRKVSIIIKSIDQ